MQYKLDGFTLDEVSIAITEQPVRIVGSVVSYRLITHKVRGKLRAENQSSIASEISSFNSKLRQNQFGSAGLYTDGGSSTEHLMTSGESMDGINVVSGPGYPTGRGAEYGTFRTFEFAVEGKFRVSDINMLAFRESVTVSGGTAPSSWLLPADPSLLPIRQRLRRSPAIIVQQGTARHYLRDFVPPTPFMEPDEGSITRAGREAAELGAGLYETSWEYRMSVPTVNSPVYPNERTIL